MVASSPLGLPSEMRMGRMRRVLSPTLMLSRFDPRIFRNSEILAIHEFQYQTFPTISLRIPLLLEERQTAGHRHAWSSRPQPVLRSLRPRAFSGSRKQGTFAMHENLHLWPHHLTFAKSPTTITQAINRNPDQQHDRRIHVW